MNPLMNNFSRDILEAKLAAEDFKRKTLSFYRYIRIEDPRIFRDQLYEDFEEMGVLGRIYIAKEGINGQINVPEPEWDVFMTYMDESPIFHGMRLNIAVEEKDQPSFIKLTIKAKEQIVADGLEDDSYNLQNIGKHLTAEEWNEAMEDPETIVVDMRNHYESRIGHFEGAMTPDVDTFREQLPMVKDDLADKKDKKVLLYCTGGIRCEKTSAYLKHHGFKDVNQLEGGIIKYTRDAKEKGLDVKFKGKNFVFDERLAETITDDVLTECDQCGEICDMQTNCSNQICHLLFVQCEKCKEQFAGACSEECKAIAILPIEEQRVIRKQEKYMKDKETYKSRLRPKLRREIE